MSLMRISQCRWLPVLWPVLPLDTDKVARLQLLACGHADFGQVSKIHIVGSRADPDHNTLAEAFLQECRAFPAGTNNRAINRAIDVLVANTLPDHTLGGTFHSPAGCDTPVIP